MVALLARCQLPPLPRTLGGYGDSSLYGHGHRGILGTKSGASAGGPGQPTTGGEAHWQTGHQATCPPPWNQTWLPAKRQSAGWSMMTRPKHGMLANSAIHCAKGTLDVRRHTPDRESEPKIHGRAGMTELREPGASGHLGHGPMPMCLSGSAPRKGLPYLVLLVSRTPEMFHGGTGPDVPGCCR